MAWKFNCSPFFTAETIFQILDLVFQLGDSSWGAGLALHVSQATAQLLQLQWHEQHRSKLPRWHWRERSAWAAVSTENAANECWMSHCRAPKHPMCMFVHMCVLVSPWRFCPALGPVWRISPASARSAADRSGLCSWSYALSGSPSCFSLPPAPVLHASACPVGGQVTTNGPEVWTLETFWRVIKLLRLMTPAALI